MGDLKNVNISELERISNISTEGLNELGSVISKTTASFSNMGKELKATDDFYKILTANVGSLNSALGLSKETQNDINSILTSGRAVLDTYTVATNLAKLAQDAFNLSMNANIIGAAITAISLLCAGIGFLINKQQEKAEKEKQELEAHEAKMKALEDERIAYEKLAIQKQAGIDANMAEVDHIQLLREQLDGLVDSNGRVDEANRGLVTFILGELNSALGTNYEMIDGQIIKNEELQSSIDSLIEKKRAQILLDAEEQGYRDSVQKYRALEIEQLGRLNEIEAINTKVKAENREATEDERLQLIRTRQEYDNKEKELKDHYTNIGKYETAYKLLNEGNTEGMLNLLQKKSDAYITADDIMQASADKNIEALGELVQSTEISAKQMREKLDAGWSGINEGAVANAESLAQIAKEEFIKLGGQIPDNMAEGAEGTSEGFKSKLVFIAESGAKGVEETNPLYVKAGENSGDGIIEGINKKRDAVYWTNFSLGQYAVKGYNDGQGAKSPAKEYEKASKNSIDGLVKGLSENEQKLVNKMLEVNYNMLETERLYQAEKQRLEEEAFNEEYNRKISSAKSSEEAEKIKQEYITRAQEDGQKKYLEALKAAADSEKAQIESTKNDIKAIYDELSKYAAEHMNEVIKAQEALEGRLNNYGSLYETVTTTIKGSGAEYTDEKGNRQKDGDIVLKSAKLSDLSRQNEELIAYKNALLSAKERLKSEFDNDTDLKIFFEKMAGMSVEEGTIYANAINSASEGEFSNYISNWQEGRSLSKEISEALYNDEVEAAFEEVKEAITDKLTEAGLEIPEGFFNSGTASAVSFGEAFMVELEAQMEKIRIQFNNYMASLFPQASFAGGGSVYTNNSNNSTTYVLGSSGEGTTQRLQSADAHATVSRLQNG